MSGKCKRLPPFGSENKLALTSTLLRTRGGMYHTFNSISSPNDPKLIYCILPLQAHRSKVYAVTVHPHPPPQLKQIQPKPSDTLWFTSAGASDPTGTCERKPKSGFSTDRR